MFLNLVLSVSSAGMAVVLWAQAGPGRMVAFAFGLLSLWQLHSAATRRVQRACGRRSSSGWAVSPGTYSVFAGAGYHWTGRHGEDGGAITRCFGRSRKTVRPGAASVSMTRGFYWETLSSMLGHLGRASDLILLQVKPDNAGPDWQPTHHFNFFGQPVSAVFSQSQNNLRRGCFTRAAHRPEFFFVCRRNCRWNLCSRRCTAPGCL